MSSGRILAGELQRQREEEKHTKYTQQDLENKYEFKILRSAIGAFRKPWLLEQALKEEALSGWLLVEKFDDSRIRLCRPRQPKQSHVIGVDPYRTNYGASGLKVALFITLGGILSSMVLVVVLMALKH